MKQILSYLFTSLLLLSLSACFDATSNDTDDQSDFPYSYDLKPKVNPLPSKVTGEKDWWKEGREKKERENLGKEIPKRKMPERSPPVKNLPICSAEFLEKYNKLRDEINNRGYFQKKHPLTEKNFDYFNDEYQKFVRLGIEDKLNDLVSKKACKSGQTIIDPLKDPTLVKAKNFVLYYDFLKRSAQYLKDFEIDTGIRFTGYTGPFQKLADYVDLEFYAQKYKELSDFNQTFQFVRLGLHELNSSLIRVQREFEELGLKNEDFKSSGFQLISTKVAALYEQIKSDLKFIKKKKVVKGKQPDFNRWKFIRYSVLFDRAKMDALSIKGDKIEDLLSEGKKIGSKIKAEIAQLCKKILALPEDASDKVIKNAFHRKFLVLHPDKQSDVNLQIPQDQREELEEVFKLFSNLKGLHEKSVKTSN